MQKNRAKLVNETMAQFKEDSDPVHDMGIGDCLERLEKLETKLRELWEEYYVRVNDDEHDTVAWEALNVIQELQEILGLEYD